jgi:predicted ATPase
MIDVHKRVHAARAAMGAAGGDPILPVARDLAKGAYILCFDEFQVLPSALAWDVLLTFAYRSPTSLMR